MEENRQTTYEILRSRHKRKQKKKIIIGITISVIIVTLSVFFGLWFYGKNQIYKVCRVEAGVAVEEKDFLVNPEKKVTFTDDSDKIDINVPGKYNLKLKWGIFEYPCTLYIEDTVAPELELKQVRLIYGDTCEIEDFIVKIEDVTKTKVSYVTPPDFNMKDKQMVSISVTDAGNNITTKETELIISYVVESLTIEAGGEKPDISDFIVAGAEGEFITNLDEIDFNVPAEHIVSVSIDGQSYDINMKIVDTVPPLFEVRDINGYSCVNYEAAEFVSASLDVTPVSASFETQPDFKKVGAQTVTIIVTDSSGNQSKKQATLTLEQDNESPVISGTRDFTIFIGAGVSYKKNVTVSDNSGRDIALNVDSSQVNLNVEGVYPVTYTATDASGNSTSVTVNVTVKEQTYDLEQVNILADDVLARIINDGMSQRDKAYAIFNYCKTNIGYINDSVKGDYVRSAYEGFVKKRGDCYVYASTAKVLLTRAGIPNMDIERIPSATTTHYWNLVDIGDGHGWYHYDTTPRWNHPTIFLWVDAQIKEYSDANDNSHNYDRTKYPEIK